LTGVKGSLVYTQERLNELLHFRANGDPRYSGYTRIEAGPQHYPYGLFCVAPGHQLGFNDLKTIEVAEFLQAISGGERQGPDFREAWEIQKIVDTAVRSSKVRTWQAIE
jgi:predicted dehydrogenase